MQRLFQRVDLASLAVLRFAFGALMVVEVTRFFRYGWIHRYYVGPSFHFTYPGFDWVQPWPGSGMYWHFGLLGLAAALMAVGLFYRVAATVFALGITYVFLLDEAQYLNHMYLICLLSFLLIFIPGGRLWALDARWGFAERSETAPRWTLLMIQAQLAVVYTFGGLAKLEPDWLSGAPGASFLAGWEVTESLAGIGWVAKLFAISGALFDLLIVPALIWKRTRLVATLAAVVFHVTNMHMFQIGIFPWLMLAATPIFYSPSWPRMFAERVRAIWLGKKARVVTLGKKVLAREDVPPTQRVRRVVTGALGLWFAIQVLVPLRHWLYPGDVNWTEQGHNFSWHMKLRNKDGSVRMFLVTPLESIELDLRDHLSARQLRKMSTRPHMVQKLARHLGEKLSRDLEQPVQIRVYNPVSLNGRPHAFIIDPTADLMTAAPETFLLERPETPAMFSVASDD